MKTTKTLAIIAENQENFEPADYTQFEIGRVNDGQIRCYIHEGVYYIGLINPLDGNRLFFADEFPYDWFSEFVQDQIDNIFN